MENGSGQERLAATRDCVIVFRLVVETTGHVLYGEILEPPTDGQHRFVGTIGLVQEVREWLREAFSQLDGSDAPSPGVADTEHGPVD